MNTRSQAQSVAFMRLYSTWSPWWLIPSAYVSGNARQTVPRAVRWSLAMLFNSPPTYWPGVRMVGKIRETTTSLRSWFSMVSILKECIHPDPASQVVCGGRRVVGTERPFTPPITLQRRYCVSYTVTGFLNSCAQGLTPGHFPQNG